ncbi:MAG: glutaredoxin, GrxB family, partial [Halobacteriovoraceae bacterium]|nr:glutaredoxin, GrxB family [Halobacteriovoraceae bacterium]
MTTYTNTLYHYVHCPFCVRVRMGLGYLKVNYKSVVLSYDDEDTPVKLIGKKMLPILDTKHGFIGESLDIIKAFDESNVLFTTDFTNQLPQIEDLLTEIGANVHSLAMPYWMWTPEFSSNSRQYFKQKKEIKRGSFNLLVKNSHSFITD